jgi:hypothetical protein
MASVLTSSLPFPLILLSSFPIYPSQLFHCLSYPWRHYHATALFDNLNQSKAQFPPPFHPSFHPFSRPHFCSPSLLHSCFSSLPLPFLLLCASRYPICLVAALPCYQAFWDKLKLDIQHWEFCRNKQT